MVTILSDPVIQNLIPYTFRDLVLQSSHGDVAGHLGVRKTYDRIVHFFWPRLKRDISAFIRLCRTCQLTGKPNQLFKPAPLYPIPVVSQPFEHLTIVCVGPLACSKAGSIYLLTVMCPVTHYPAAASLRAITTKSVRALTRFISVFGIPKMIKVPTSLFTCLHRCYANFASDTIL